MPVIDFSGSQAVWRVGVGGTVGSPRRVPGAWDARPAGIHRRRLSQFRGLESFPWSPARLALRLPETLCGGKIDLWAARPFRGLTTFVDVKIYSLIAHRQGMEFSRAWSINRARTEALWDS
jgi:hypothetical protein